MITSCQNQRAINATDLKHLQSMYRYECLIVSCRNFVARHNGASPARVASPWGNITVTKPRTAATTGSWPFFHTASLRKADQFQLHPPRGQKVYPCLARTRPGIAVGWLPQQPYAMPLQICKRRPEIIDIERQMMAPDITVARGRGVDPKPHTGRFQSSDHSCTGKTSTPA